ncbi:hypothetical protein ACFUIT_38435 [Streptomyces sp. NPDC057239]|uniref:hypothetical protein n=1 Tax=Streptomyces sp. NPDC057239 TaxID=3346061 RepID=UPI00364499E6
MSQRGGTSGAQEGRAEEPSRGAKRYQPDYGLLDETVVELEKLFGIVACEWDGFRALLSGDAGRGCAR